MPRDTIAAIATAKGSGGIGIVKISGPKAFDIGQVLFRSGKTTTGTDSTENRSSFPTEQSHRLFYGKIHRPSDDNPIDEVLLSIMKAPKSYTGEDMVEINCHGGNYVTRLVLETVVGLGARLAEPGEFTKRAFLNGRIDLTQAEAVVDLIQARTNGSLQIANAHLKGEFGEKIRETKKRMEDLLVLFEAAIDFPDEAGDALDRDGVLDEVRDKIKGALSGLLQMAEAGKILRQGLTCAVVGKPNVGKSSLINRLLKEERVIVTPIPGTTRDTVAESIHLKGTAIVIVDTAGIHQTEETVERIGIEKALSAAREADLILFMVDGSQGVDKQDQDIFETFPDKRKIVIVNKADIMEDPEAFTVPNGLNEGAQVLVSAKTGVGIEKLEKRILKEIELHWDESGEGADLAPNLRQRISLETALESVDRLEQQILESGEEELLAFEARDAVRHLDEILGESFDEQLLDRIFQRFCVGK